MCYGFVFFFKQKTAYDMRISDWSSDVCCSDLQIEDDRVIAFGGAQEVAVLAVGGEVDGVSRPFERRAELAPHIRFVLDDENPHHCPLWLFVPVSLSAQPARIPMVSSAERLVGLVFRESCWCRLTKRRHQCTT